MQNPFILIVLVVLVAGGFALFLNRDVGSGAAGLSSVKSPSDSPATIGSLPAAEFSEFAAKNPQAVIIDIRTPEEIAAGKIAGALEIDFYADSFEQEILALDPTKQYYLYCRSGNRTKAAAALMQQAGFERVQDLTGGIQAWVSAGMPTCQEC